MHPYRHPEIKLGKQDIFEPMIEFIEDQAHCGIFFSHYAGNGRSKHLSESSLPAVLERHSHKIIFLFLASGVENRERFFKMTFPALKQPYVKKKTLG